MRRYRLGTLAALVLVVLLAGAFVIAHLLDADALRPLAERELTGLLHVPVHIGRLHLRFRPVPALEGSDVTIAGLPASGPPSLTIGQVRLVPRISTLLSSMITIDTVELRGVRLDVLREADGRWALPGPALVAAPLSRPRTPEGSGASASPAASATGGHAAGGRGTSFLVNGFTIADGTVAVFDAGRTAPAAVIDQVAATLRGDARRLTVEQFSAAVGRSTLSGSGTIGSGGTELAVRSGALHPEDMPKLFALAGITAPSGVVVDGAHPLTLELKDGRAGLEVRGRFVATRLVLPPLSMSDVESPFEFRAGRLDVAPLVLQAYRGAFRGRLRTVTADAPVAWRLDGALEHADLGELLASTTSAGRRVSGTGRLQLAVRGEGGGPMMRTLAGTAGLAIADGVIRDFPLLASIDRALGITGSTGNDTRFDRVDGTFTLGGGRAVTRGARLVAGSLTVTLSGAIGLEDRALDLAGTARFTREKTAELMTISKHVGGAKNENGEVELPLSIRGTFAAPDFDIDLGSVLANAAKKELERGIRRELNKLFKP